MKLLKAIDGNPGKHIFTGYCDQCGILLSRDTEILAGYLLHTHTLPIDIIDMKLLNPEDGNPTYISYSLYFVRIRCKVTLKQLNMVTSAYYRPYISMINGLQQLRQAIQEHRNVIYKPFRG